MKAGSYNKQTEKSIGLLVLYVSGNMFAFPGNRWKQIHKKNWQNILLECSVYVGLLGIADKSKSISKK